MARFIDTNLFVACLRGRADHARDKFLSFRPDEILVPFHAGRWKSAFSPERRIHPAREQGFRIRSHHSSVVPHWWGLSSAGES
jgi:hypothetical protein